MSLKIKRGRMKEAKKTIRPQRWAWRVDRVEMSRVEIIRLWHLMKSPNRVPVLGIWFIDGIGAVTGYEKRKNEIYSVDTVGYIEKNKCHEILTLRQLLKEAKKDYKKEEVK